MPHFYKTALQVHFKLHLHLFSPRFNYRFHATTAVLRSVMEVSTRWELAKCLRLLSQSFLEKRTLVCLQIQDKAHRRFKWERDVSRVFFRFSFILKKRCKWQREQVCWGMPEHPPSLCFSSELWRYDVQVLSKAPETAGNMPQCIYFLCMGLLPIFHITCDLLFPFMASNQREWRSLMRNNPFCKWTSEQLLQAAGLQVLMLWRCPGNMPCYIFLGVKYFKERETFWLSLGMSHNKVVSAICC